MYNLKHGYVLCTYIAQDSYYHFILDTPRSVVAWLDLVLCSQLLQETGIMGSYISYEIFNPTRA